VRPLKSNQEVVINTVEGDLPRRFEKLTQICSIPKDGFKVNDIYRLMFNIRMYEVAYHKLKSNPGNMTPGIIPVTLDGMSLEWIEETINQMKDGSFQFKPGRRVQIPKPGSSKTRPLTIAPPRDKVVQEVMRMILEVIFEPTFSNNSHGFRPNRSCHTALRQVKTQFGASTTIIEGDISKCFDSFDHEVLIGLIERKVSDKRFIHLVWKALKAGYMEFHSIQHSIKGTPQGSIVSPLLANIYLHELDLYIETLKAKYEKGTNASRNPEYRRLEYLRSKANKAGDFDLGIKYLKEMQQIKSRLLNDSSFRRLYYVRYADDWIVAIRGPRSDAVNMLQSIRMMLKDSLKLDLSVEKSKITNPRVEPALFLGTQISISNYVGSTIGKNHQRLRVVSQLRMLAPLDRIYKKLTINGFMSAQYKSGVPRFIWLANDKDNIIKLYNSVLRGYLNYYSFTHNYPKVASSLEFILKTSCAKLLAAKFKLRSVTEVISKYGKDLKGDGKTGFLKPSYKIDVWGFKSKPKDRIKTLFAPYLSAATLDSLECAKCKSTDRVEMHHVRLLSDLNPKLSEVDRIMAKRRRKQIPLCRNCHLEHHKNQKPWGKKVF
jgi:group II intron reverse transcriptase/maturase